MFSHTSIAIGAKLHDSSRSNLTGNKFDSHPNNSFFKSMEEVNKPKSEVTQA